jgi:hypothetical protein
MVAMRTEQALTSGLFGPTPHAPEVKRRLGDLLLTMRKGHTLLTNQETLKLARIRGRHGGMTTTEMEVPWLGLRLDA